MKKLNLKNKNLRSHGSADFYLNKVFHHKSLSFLKCALYHSSILEQYKHTAYLFSVDVRIGNFHLQCSFNPCKGFLIFITASILKTKSEEIESEI